MALCPALSRTPEPPADPGRRDADDARPGVSPASLFRAAARAIPASAFLRSSAARRAAPKPMPGSASGVRGGVVGGVACLSAPRYGIEGIRRGDRAAATDDETIAAREDDSASESGAATICAGTISIDLPPISSSESAALESKERSETVGESAAPGRLGDRPAILPWMPLRRRELAVGRMYCGERLDAADCDDTECVGLPSSSSSRARRLRRDLVSTASFPARRASSAGT